MDYSEANVRNVLSRLSTAYASNLIFYLNDKAQIVNNIDPHTLLVDYLRDSGHTGTKYGCGEGSCGACTVVVAEFDPSRNQIKYRTANSCLLLLCLLHWKQVITVEGLGNQNNPHPVQVRMLCATGRFLFSFSQKKIILGAHSQRARVTMWFLHARLCHVSFRAFETQRVTFRH